MARLLFEKKDRAVWISHLDLMRLFQRAFKRAGLPLTHTHGYNPRPSVSIALPMSVGVSSCCELLDFELEGELPPCDEIRDRLNDALVEGIKVLHVSHGGRKIRDLALLRCRVELQYDNGVPLGALKAVEELFSRQSLSVAKKSKSGPVEQDIIPMIKNLTVGEDEKRLHLDALICCQNPSLNPMQLLSAVEHYLPQYKPDHGVCCRVEIYDLNETVFR